MCSESAVSDDDILQIVDDEPADITPNSDRVWRILIVDDDNDIHEATRLAIKDKIILDRPLELLHAHSATEGRKMILAHRDIAVALIDVVMETPFAGLNLVRELREAGFTEMRVVLRTGQPGYAPEQSVISSYEIDDYRTKSELTQTRLLTVLTAGVRAYNQICTISRSREGLEMIVESATQLFRRTNLELFSNGVLTQISALLDIEPNGIVCADATDKRPGWKNRIISAVGRFEPYIGKTLEDIADDSIRNLLDKVHTKSQPFTEGGYLALKFQSESGRALLTLVETDCDIAGHDLSLLKLFAANISIAYENLGLVEELDRLAFVDPVLQVPNQNAFEAALRIYLVRQPQEGRVAFLKVDSYQYISASYGLRVANRYLTAVYNELTHRMGDTVTIASLGDGSFAMLGDKSRFSEGHILGAFVSTHKIDGIDIASTATAALIDLSDIRPDPTTVMRTASTALLQISQSRRGECVTYDAAMRADVERRLYLQVALKHAVEHGEGFSVHLQPKVHLASGKVVSAEALLRWNHSGEAISPAEFIPIAESAGMMEKLTGFVLDTVAFWSAGHGEDALPVAVNLSMVNLNSPGFAERLLEQIAIAGLSPKTVEFEVTEGIAMQDKPWAIEQTQALKNAGYRIALDDFGTGYSSLAHFDRLPIDTLKIDRFFVAALTVKNARDSLPSIVISMAKTLNVDCVAEGIETAEQEQALIFLGCGIGQGYHLGRPISIGEFNDRYLQDAT